jgi:hypothetical protein
MGEVIEDIGYFNISINSYINQYRIFSGFYIVYF